jgi:hypothetical protein
MIVIRCAIFVCIIFHTQVERTWPRIAKKKSDTFLFAGKALKATGTFHIMLRLLYFRMKMDQLYGEVRWEYLFQEAVLLGFFTQLDFYQLLSFFFNFLVF